MDVPAHHPESAETWRFHRGDVVAKRFTLRQPIGRSRAEVWLADQADEPSWPSTIALKLITSPSPEETLRLKAEHELCCRTDLMDVAFIPRSFYQGECSVRGENVAYLAREFVDGEDILKHANGRHLPMEARVDLMIKVCEGVAALHERRIRHRDLKPANIFVDASGQPKLIDFGSAVDAAKREKANLTIVTEAIHRSEGYAPPEAYGQNALSAFMTASEPWDVYSLGVVLADLLTGIRDQRQQPLDITPVVENDLELHHTLRHMAQSLPAGECQRAAEVRGCTSTGQWFDTLDPFIENVSLQSRHDLTSVRYGTAGRFASCLREWRRTSVEQRYSQSPLRLNKRARQVSINEQHRYLALITGVGSLVRERKYTQARQLLRDIDRGVGGDRSKQTTTWEYRHFELLLNGLATVMMHEAHVNSAEFSSDGTRVVTATDDGIARVWDAVTGSVIAETERHGAPLLSAVFSPDLTRVATTSDDGKASVWEWDATTGDCSASHLMHNRRVNSVHFTNDGSRVVTASDDETAKVWDVFSGAAVATLRGHAGGVNCAFFSPDATTVVTGGEDATARVWSASTGQPRATLSGHALGFSELQGVRSLNLSPDGKYVLTATGDGTARVWDLDGTPVAVLSGHDNSAQVISARFSPDGTRVVTASADATARIWDKANGLHRTVLRGHGDAVIDAHFSPDGTRVVTASLDGTARVWDALCVIQPTVRGGDHLLREVAVLRGHEGPLILAAFCPKGRRILTIGRDDMTVRIWSGSEVENVLLKSHPDGLRCRHAAPSPDGRWIIATHGDDSATLYDASSGESHDVFRGNTAYSMGFATFSPDGSRVVTCSADGVAKVWDVSSGDPLAELAPDRNELAEELLGRPEGTQPSRLEEDVASWVVVAAFSPSGDRVVTAHQDKIAHVWNSEQGTRIASLVGHAPGLIQSVAFSPEGTTVATASTDGTARVWDAFTGKLLAELSGHHDKVNSVAFSPSGRRVVTASNDKTACVWDWAQKECVSVLRGHTHSIRSATFSPDGTRVLTAARDEGSAELESASVRMWHADTGTELVTLDCPNVVSATFSHDGRRVVAVSWDGGVRTWHTQSPQERSADLAARCSAEAAQTVLRAAEARLSFQSHTPPSHGEILRAVAADVLATAEVVAEVERMLRARQRFT